MLLLLLCASCDRAFLPDFVKPALRGANPHWLQHVAPDRTAEAAATVDVELLAAAEACTQPGIFTREDGTPSAGIAPVQQQGLTIVPLSAYFNDKSFLKVSIGLARGKKLQDKREDLKRKDMAREVSRQLKAFR